MIYYLLLGVWAFGVCLYLDVAYDISVLSAVIVGGALGVAFNIGRDAGR